MLKGTFSVLYPIVITSNYNSFVLDIEFQVPKSLSSAHNKFIKLKKNVLTRK
jgi:hypothetical protein